MNNVRLYFSVASLLKVLGLSYTFWLLSLSGNILLAAVVVAAADSLPTEKSRADFVCDGTDDQIELAKSLALARRATTLIDVDPKTQVQVESAVNHAVVWLPGTYYLSETLEIPDSVNCSITAEGTTLKYLPSTGDTLVIRGMNRCRFRFGTVETQSTGVALRIQPNKRMPALMSFIEFAGLVGKDQRGIGLMLDSVHENVCVNRITGTDISGFDKGVFVGDAGERDGAASTHGKCDTNWFWLSYIRLCKTGIEESATGVDCSVWQVNVDASLPDSVAIRTAGAYGKWYVIMGTYGYEKKNRALVLESPARHNVFEMHPPIQEFLWEDNSGSDTNIILSSQSPPYRPITELRSE